MYVSTEVPSGDGSDGEYAGECLLESHCPIGEGAAELRRSCTRGDVSEQIQGVSVLAGHGEVLFRRFALRWEPSPLKFLGGSMC